MPKICDFGFCFECKDKKNAKRLGTYEYCAPEILRKNGFEPYDCKKADIFSLGITLLNLVTGKQQNEIIGGFIRDKIEYNFCDFIKKIKILIKDLSPKLQMLIIKMLDFNPDERPSSIEKILDDSWMEEVKKDDLNQEKDLYKEFERREKTITDNTTTSIEEEDSKEDSKNVKNKSSKEDKNEINFEKRFILKNIKENEIESGDYLIINGKLNPFKFMNNIINQLKTGMEGGFVRLNENYYIIEVQYQYENEDEVEDEDEGEKLNENEEEKEEELIDYKYGIFKKDLFIQIILFESDDGNYILQFYKKAGEIEDYYMKLEKIISIIKESIKTYK